MNTHKKIGISFLEKRLSLLVNDININIIMILLTLITLYLILFLFG